MFLSAKNNPALAQKGHPVVPKTVTAVTDRFLYRLFELGTLLETAQGEFEAIAVKAHHNLIAYRDDRYAQRAAGYLAHFFQGPLVAGYVDGLERDAPLREKILGHLAVGTGGAEIDFYFFAHRRFLPFQHSPKIGCSDRVPALFVPAFLAGPGCVLNFFGVATTGRESSLRFYHDLDGLLGR